MTLCTPQAGVDPARTMRPAVAAGVTDHGWTMHARAFSVKTRTSGPCARYGQDDLSVARTVPTAPRPVTHRATVVYLGPEDNTPPSVRSSPCRNFPTRSQPCSDCWTEFVCMTCWHSGGCGILCNKRADTVGHSISTRHEYGYHFGFSRGLGLQRRYTQDTISAF
jgi:hypothetical protein